jgi:hypothetical protein
MKNCAMKTRKVFIFVLFHLSFRIENHICRILLYDFRLHISKETSKERLLKKIFSSKKWKYLKRTVVNLMLRYIDTFKNVRELVSGRDIWQ